MGEESRVLELRRPPHVYRSLICNPIDKMVNCSIKHLLREKAFQRDANHVDRHPGATLNRSQRTMKVLLLTWLTKWCKRANQHGIVSGSWHSVMNGVPTRESVDNVAHAWATIDRAR